MGDPSGDDALRQRSDLTARCSPLFSVIGYHAWAALAPAGVGSLVGRHCVRVLAIPAPGGVV
jgi:hypothetical protein